MTLPSPVTCPPLPLQPAPSCPSQPTQALRFLRLPIRLCGRFLALAVLVGHIHVMYQLPHRPTVGSDKARAVHNGKDAVVLFPCVIQGVLILSFRVGLLGSVCVVWSSGMAVCDVACGGSDRGGFTSDLPSGPSFVG